jgi:hypothetical protein
MGGWAPEPYPGSHYVDFDGVNDYVTCHAAAAPLASDRMSGSLWMLCAAPPGGWQVMFSCGAAAGLNPEWNIGLSAAGNAYWYAERPDGSLDVLTIGTDVIADGTWHHVGWTWSAGAGRLFVDGALDKSFAYTGDYSGVDRAAVGTRIRNASVANHCAFQCASLALWPRVMAAEEMARVYAGGKAIDLRPLRPSHYLWMGDRDEHPSLRWHGYERPAAATMTNMVAGDIAAGGP